MSSRVRITDISDGSSNTAMFSETKRTTNCGTGTSDYDPTVVYLIPATDPGWSILTPMFGPMDQTEPASTHALITGTATYRCNAWDYGPIWDDRYRGCEYYRGYGPVSLYTHTVPPNYKGYDCAERSSYTAAHIAARSYHSGGVNVCFADGSVHFISDSINFGTWQAIGTSRAGDLVGSY